MPSPRTQRGRSEDPALTALLASLAPALSDTDYVFCSFADATVAEKLHLAPFASCVEAEGLSLIIARSTAEQYRIPIGVLVFRAITLTVRSSLEAVGLTAAVAGRLALHGISANVVAAFHHDHIFVPARDAERALRLLQALQAEAAARIAIASTIGGGAGLPSHTGSEPS